MSLDFKQLLSFFL